MFLFSRLQYLPIFASVFVHFPPASTLSNTNTSITLLYQNNLNASDDKNHVGFLLLDPHSPHDAEAACEALNEKLLPLDTIQKYRSDLQLQLSYQAYRNDIFSSESQLYTIENGFLSYSSDQGLSFPQSSSNFNNTTTPKYSILCTQSSVESQPWTSIASPANKISIPAAGNTYTGFRNQKSFRFLGVPYADPPARFEYTRLYSKTGQNIDATSYGEQCLQASGGSEDCLFLNIQTPYIPKASSSSSLNPTSYSRNYLRPVLFWIHGGGFVFANGSDSLTDGGNMASREDIVVVNVNYRLSTLGFLAVPGTGVKGNYGIADQILGLEWTKKNIASFGGDPNRITIMGESAGAGSIRVLLGSPPASGKFHGAVAMSNLGGGSGLGLESDYATTYSGYLSISESYALAGQNIFLASGCNQTSVNAQIECLKTVPALPLVQQSINARYVVQDGHFVVGPELDLKNRSGTTAFVNVMFGLTSNDGASIGSTYPSEPVTSHLQGLALSLGISESNAQSIIDSNLFPLYNTGNLTLDSFNVSQRIATDKDFRCIDQATVFAGSANKIFKSAHFYEVRRSIGGYDPNHLGGARISPGYPDGNPELPYFKLHTSELPWLFGAFDKGLKFRDEKDWWSVQLSVGYFGAFVRGGDPNPEGEFLRKRGYEVVEGAVNVTGEWEEVSGEGGKGRMMGIDWPGEVTGLKELEQCKWLGYPVDYYV